MRKIVISSDEKGFRVNHFVEGYFDTIGKGRDDLDSYCYENREDLDLVDCVEILGTDLTKMKVVEVDSSFNYDIVIGSTGYERINIR